MAAWKDQNGWESAVAILTVLLTEDPDGDLAVSTTTDALRNTQAADLVRCMGNIAAGLFSYVAQRDDREAVEILQTFAVMMQTRNDDGSNP